MGQSETQRRTDDVPAKNNKTTTPKGDKKAWYKNKVVWGVFGGVVVLLIIIIVVLNTVNKKSYEIIDLKGKTVKTACEIAKENGWNPYITIWSSGNDYRQGDCYSELEVQDYEYNGGYCWGISSSSSTKKNVCIDVYDNGYTGSSSDTVKEEEEVEIEETEEVVEEPKTQPSTNSSSSQQSQSSSSGNSEWKQFLKDYEAWVDKYITFMKKYKNASATDIASMMSEYSSLMSDLTSWSEKTKNMQSGLSGSDLTEYLNALSRITQKLNSF